MHDHSSYFINWDILLHALEITGIVFIMMLIIDWLDVRTRGKIPRWITRRKSYQYIISSFLGTTPGCMGAYMNVSLYMHGYLTMGAIVGGMIATSGEVSLVMFAQFPGKALLIHIFLFGFGIMAAVITDFLIKQFDIKYKIECESVSYHEDEHSLTHYVTEHVWRHIIKKHIVRIFLWTLFAIWAVHLGMQYLDIRQFVESHPLLLYLIAILIGLIPDVAPQFIFVFMFSEGLIPIGVLVTSATVQNGHALIPLLSYCIRDTIIIKAFNTAFGLIIAAIFILS